MKTLAPIEPDRIYDSRQDPRGRLAAGETRAVAVGHEWATLHVTAIDTVAPGYLSISGSPLGNDTSLVNFDVDGVESDTASIALPDQIVYVFSLSECDVAIDLFEIDVDVEPDPGDPPAAAPDTVVDFDTFFTGATVDDKIRQLNEWAITRPSGSPTVGVQFRQRRYVHTTPIWRVSGLFLFGGRGAAREYSRTTVLHYAGPTGTSQFIDVTDLPTGARRQPAQSYPNEYAPRHMHIEGIQFSGGATVHWMPKQSMNYGADPWNSRRVVWASTFHNVGWVGFATVMWGWSNVLTVSGGCHAQAYSDTPLYLGGAENHWFTAGQSVLDSNAPAFATSGKPTLRSVLDKSFVGPTAMITARQSSWGLSIEGGHGTRYQIQVDAQDSDPMDGPGVRVSGGSAVELDGCCLKGMAASSTAEAWIAITGAVRQLLIHGCKFIRRGPEAPPMNRPIIRVAAGVGQAEVKVGVNLYDSWGTVTDRVIVLQSTPGQVFLAAADPKVMLAVTS